MRRPLMVSLLLRAMLAAPACLFLAGCAGSPEGALTGLLAGAADQSSQRPSQIAPDDGASVQAPALAFAEGESMLDRARRIAAAKGLGRPPAESSTPDAASPLGNAPVSAAPVPAAPVAALLAQRAADAGALRAEPSSAADGLDIAEANARIRAAAERLRAERASAQDMRSSVQDMRSSTNALRVEPRSGGADDPREMFRRAVELARARSLEEQRQAFGGLADLAPAVAEPPAPSYFMQAIRMRQADAGAVQSLGLAR